MYRLAACILALLCAVPASAQPLQTVAEKSGYKETSRYADVIGFCEAIAKRGPVARLEYFGESQEKRKLPLLILSDPPVSSIREAKEAGKTVVLSFANIHAGEVDGKEAMLALARDLTDRKNHPLLKHLVILIVPILNADGNEKFAANNRPGQNGPPLTGTRANGQGLDLNRDFIKLDSPEIRALVKLFNTWDPALIIDCHTTNGSKHRHTLTYDGPRYPTHGSSVAEWANESLFPAVTKKVKAATGFDICPYGNFNRDRTKWETYLSGPRFGVQYVALRGRVGILSESYSYASFADRVKATHAFVTACFEVAAAERAELAKAIAAAGPNRVLLRTRTESFPAKIAVLGFEEIVTDGRRIATDKPREYSLEYVARVVTAESGEMPYAYIVPARHGPVLEALQRHGIGVEELREDIDLDTDRFAVASATAQRQPFQKRRLIPAIEGKWQPAPARVPAGTFVVKTAQPLGTLAAYLLEPRSEDGLATWDYFGDSLAANQPYPVARLMKPYPLALGEAPVLPENRIVDQPLTEAMLLGRAGFALQGTTVAPGAWIDADHFLQTKDGMLWKISARTGKVEPFAEPELIRKSLGALKEVEKANIESQAKAVNFRLTPDQKGFQFNIGPDIGIGYFDGRPAIRLTKGAGAREHLTLSPNARSAAFIRGGNLYASTAEKPEDRQLTTDGGGDILNGKGDWVYEEEIFNRNGRAFWWSPDNQQIAFLRFDDTPVKRFHIVDFSGVRGSLETYAYPKPGEPNPLVKIGVVSAAGGKPVFLELAAYKPEDMVICRVGWMPGGKSPFAYVQNRTQTWLDFVVWDTPESKPRTLFRETTKAWVDDLGEPHFLSDGSFLIFSERSGWKHLYHYAADGRLIGPVTEGEWEARQVLRVDAEQKQVYFTAAMTSPTGLDLCRATLDGKKIELLTEKGKTHRVSLAPSGPLFIDRFSDRNTPTRVAVREAGAGEVRMLDFNPARDRNQYKLGRSERVTIPMKDGFLLEGAITYPPNFDEKIKYPVWLFTYAGPHAPTIRDDFGGRMSDSLLAQSGIIVFNVDPRSASGKGAQSTWTCYKQLGVQELKDLEEAVAWLGKNPYVDLTRVGISGHSYGGFMAAFALTHSKTFSAGIASAPVTDWKLYDTIYTERYMLTPKENPEGYAKSSCVAAAKNLHGKLLILHGMIDDNVHLQNSVQFIEALQRANKEFEMMLYPQSRHGIGGQHVTRLRNDFIRRAMGVK